MLPSPFYQATVAVSSKKQKILKELDKLRLRVKNTEAESQCTASCHIMEHNHMLEVLKELIHREL